MAKPDKRGFGNEVIDDQAEVKINCILSEIQQILGYKDGLLLKADRLAKEVGELLEDLEDLGVLVVKTFKNSKLNEKKKLELYNILRDLHAMIKGALSAESNKQFGDAVFDISTEIRLKFTSLGNEGYWGNNYDVLLEIEEARKKLEH